MPKVKPLTKREREAQAIEREVERACDDFLRTVKMKRALEEKTFAQVADEIGICTNALQKWRKGQLPRATFGLVLEAYARMGYRLVLEPINERA